MCWFIERQAKDIFVQGVLVGPDSARKGDNGNMYGSARPCAKF